MKAPRVILWRSRWEDWGSEAETVAQHQAVLHNGHYVEISCVASDPQYKHRMRSIRVAFKKPDGRSLNEKEDRWFSSYRKAEAEAIKTINTTLDRSRYDLHAAPNPPTVTP